jgi:pantoate--beta-alanine ligase
MKQVSTISDIRSSLAELRAAGKTIAFVPTMGALHEGHLSLMRLAKEKASEVVVSIYVNPTQFGPNEDFDSYPRQMETDLKACEDEGVSVVFTPNDQIMYGSGKRYFGLTIDELNKHMDGGSRSGFFEGIALVVNKFFNIIEPDIAVFGQKDIQQFQILSRMVEEFNHDIELVAAPIARANDGLALSSRNAYLSDRERKIAPGLYRALQYVGKQIRDGVHKPKLLLKHQQDEKLEPGETYILAGAAYLGKTRLIDNIILDL